MWFEAGSPAQGQLFILAKYAKKQYKSAIKFVVRNKDFIIKCNVAKSLRSKNPNEFWNEINKLKPKVNVNANVIDNVRGDQNIANKFGSLYCELYNEFESDKNLIKNKVNSKITDICLNNKCNYSHSIDNDLVKKCVKSMKSGKIDPIYNISSDCLKNGPDILYIILAQIFNLMISHGTSCHKFNSSIIVPIIKNKRKSSNISSNYRAISLSSIMCKLFESILSHKLDNEIVSNDYQCGYKANYSTTLCSFLVNQTIQYYSSNGSNAYTLFLDASKAFDRVKHDLLFQRLLDIGVCPLYVRIISIMYSFNNAKVKWKDSFSFSFNLTNGVKQGGNFSPKLFSIYLDPMLNEIQSSNVGCHIGDTPANAFAYADDIVLIAPTIASLNKLVRICELYSTHFSLKFNSDKSFIQVFNHRSNVNIDNIDVYFFNDKIDVLSEVNHLGFIYNSCSKSIYNFEGVIKNIKSRSNVIIKEFKSIDTQSKVNLFKSQCLSLYGCELWDLKDKNIGKLEVAWRQCCRAILGLPSRTRSYMLPALMKSPSILNIIHSRAFNFYIRGINHKNKTIEFFFKNCLFNYNGWIGKNVNHILRLYNLSYDVLFSKKRFKFKDEISDWRTKLILELIHNKDYLISGPLSNKEMNDILIYVATF